MIRVADTGTGMSDDVKRRAREAQRDERGMRCREQRSDAGGAWSGVVA